MLGMQQQGAASGVDVQEAAAWGLQLLHSRIQMQGKYLEQMYDLYEVKTSETDRQGGARRRAEAAQDQRRAAKETTGAKRKRLQDEWRELQLRIGAAREVRRTAGQRRAEAESIWSETAVRDV